MKDLVIEQTTNRVAGRNRQACFRHRADHVFVKGATSLSCTTASATPGTFQSAMTSAAR